MDDQRLSDLTGEKVRLQNECRRLNIEFHPRHNEDSLRELIANHSSASRATEEPRRSRREEGRRSRRSRGSNDLSHQMKLGVGFERDPNFEYRWINGGLDNQRLYDKTRPDTPGADWEPVSKDGQAVDEKSDSVGTALRRAVGTNQANEVEYAYLCRKPKDLYQEDHAALQASNDKRMEAIQDGTAKEQKVNDPTQGTYGREMSMSIPGARAIKV